MAAYDPMRNNQNDNGDQRAVPPQGGTTYHALTTFNGSSHTLISQEGAFYDTLTYFDIKCLTEQPGNVVKEEARAIVPSSYNLHDARGHAAQRLNGTFGALCGDIDKGNHSMNAVVAAVATVVGAGVEFLVYSSSSATPITQKWRYIIPLTDTLPGEEYPDIQEAFFSLMAEQGIECDQALARTGQIVFLPNVPPARRGEDGEPLYYRRHIEDGLSLSFTRTHPVILRTTEMRRAEREAQEQATREAASRRIDRAGAQLSLEERPIDWYNGRHSIAECLARYGYNVDRRGRWMSPLQESDVPGTIIVDDGQAFVTFSGSDQAAGIGVRPRVTKGAPVHYGDAFDLFLHYEHGGDHTSAFADVRRMMGKTAVGGDAEWDVAAPVDDFSAMAVPDADEQGQSGVQEDAGTSEEIQAARDEEPPEGGTHNNDDVFEQLGDEVTDAGTSAAFKSFDDAIAALKVNKADRPALNAALGFYVAMTAVDKVLAEDQLSSASGLSKRTLRAAGHEIEMAENPARDWTHSEIADDFLKSMKRRGLLPVANSGGLYIYSKDTGIWLRKNPPEIRTVIGRRYRVSKNSKSHSDYGGITNMLLYSVADEEFFASATPGVATAQHFFRANIKEGKVEKVAHSEDNRARFALQFDPVFKTPPAEFIATLRQAFIRAPDIAALANAAGFTGNADHWERLDPAGHMLAVDAFIKEEDDRADEQIELLRQMMGAALLGLQQRRQVAVMLKGQGNSFKSATLRIIEKLFEPQAVTSVAPTELDSEYARANLAHKRLNCVPELDHERLIPAAAFKSIVGQDRVSARLPYGQPFTYVNEAAFWTASNHFPSTRDQSDAFFRRWVIIEFKVGRKQSEVDLNLEPRIMKNELPLITGWALEGAHTMLGNGGQPPVGQDHRDNIDRWRTENNTVASWLHDDPKESGIIAIPMSQAALSISIGYSKYCEWCRATQRKPYGRNTFVSEMERLGHAVRRNRTSGRLFAGLRKVDP